MNLSSNYSPPLLYSNGHFNTIGSYLFRNNALLNFKREEFILSDGDFLDLDWHRSENKARLAILIHGLEGSSSSGYIQHLAAHLSKEGLDVLAFNFRSCSGRMNNKLISYHSGKTDDLREVVEHIEKGDRYESLYLIGFSLGGNASLKLGAELGTEIPSLKGIIGISVPLDLAGSSKQLSNGMNRIYLRQFLHSLKRKASIKLQQHAHAHLDQKAIMNSSTFHEYDGAFTAPIHGFTSADDYYEKSSSLPVLSQIQRSSLLINAYDDPFLNEACYPSEKLVGNSNLTLCYPNHGGHVGFATSLLVRKSSWHELQIAQFLREN